MDKNPIVTLTISGRPATGRIALAWKIREALKPLGLKVNINDPEQVDFRKLAMNNSDTNIELIDDVLTQVNATINIEFETTKNPPLPRSSDGFNFPEEK
jgi:hypothetical protein